jgi:hypothetical protein
MGQTWRCYARFEARSSLPVAAARTAAYRLPPPDIGPEVDEVQSARDNASGIRSQLSFIANKSITSIDPSCVVGTSDISLTFHAVLAK